MKLSRAARLRVARSCLSTLKGLAKAAERNEGVPAWMRRKIAELEREVERLRRPR